MAPGAIAVSNAPAIIESDVTPRVITIKDAAIGTISNKSGDRVFLGFDVAVTTSEAQSTGRLFLDAGDSVKIPKGTKVLNHRAKTTTAILFYNPDSGLGWKEPTRWSS